MSENKVYLSVSTTAKLVRGMLKKEFPGVKFFVNCEHGYAIRVAWVDGPCERKVNSLIGHMRSRKFDSMNDLTTFVSHWLLPNGEFVTLVGERDNALKPHPEAVLCDTGMDFLSLYRAVSEELAEEVRSKIVAETGWEDLRLAEGSVYVNRKKSLPSFAIEIDFTNDMRSREFWIGQVYKSAEAGNVDALIAQNFH